MDFASFTDAIERRLGQPLPGEAAHERMMAGARMRMNIKPNERTRKSAILILFYPYQGEIYLPLILRPLYDGVHSGQMAFPGGRAERTDENLTRTALREAQEEIGIRVSDVKVLGEMTELFIPPSNFFVQPVIGMMNCRPDFYPDPREVEQVVEVPLSVLLDKTIVGDTQIDIKGGKIDAPFFQVQDHKVWGATAMIISELLAVIDSAK